MTAKKKLFWLIAIATFVRIIIAVTLNLGNDEVYYVTYAQHLQWNYFDHPPMVALLIRLTTFNLYFNSEFFIRLGPIILAALNTALIFNCAKKIKDEQAGFIAALLFTASPYCSIIAGTFILPDAPQLFFWISSVFLLINILLKRQSCKKINIQLLWFGLIVGLCIMSKIHGIFIWIGFCVYILFNKRYLLKNIYLYTAAIITAIIIAPILIWNIDNNFITYTFHSDRVIVKDGLHIDSFLQEFLGGIFYNNPFNYFLIAIALFSLFTNKYFISTSIKKLLLLLSLPLIIILLTLSLFRDTLPHWSGPAYIPLIIIAGCFISYKLNTNLTSGIKLQKIAFLSASFLLVITIAGIMLINLMPGTLGKKNIAALGDGDFTLDMYGWKEIKNKFKTIHDANIKNNVTATSFIIHNKWFPGAHIDNYIAQPLQLNFVAIGDTNDIHQYAWLNAQRKKLQLGNDAYCLVPSNYVVDVTKIYKNYFDSIMPPQIIQQKRNGKLCRQILIYHLKKYLKQ